MIDSCHTWICFAPVDGSGPKIFGFSEFLVGLALMVIAWTISDVRYRFRIQTSRLPLVGGSFAAVSIIGLLTLLSDLWRAENWPVPIGNLLTPASWQAVLGGTFLLTFLAWSWFATIKPPVFGKRNSRRFAVAVYRLILRATPAELAVLADELSRSASGLIRVAPSSRRREVDETNNNGASVFTASDYARDVLQLLADRRFCRALVESAPNTALIMFRAIIEERRYEALPSAFSRNFIAAAFSYRDSFVYHETSGYDSGFLGHFQPLLQAIYGSYEVVEANPGLLKPDYFDTIGWTSREWEAYKRIVLLALDSYCQAGLPSRGYALHDGFTTFAMALGETYKLNGATELAWEAGPYARLRIATGFAADAIRAIDEHPIAVSNQSRLPAQPRSESIYDTLAELVYEIILAVSTVRTPPTQCWMVQHNTVWAVLFTMAPSSGPGGTLVRQKLSRKLYADITELSRFPNFKGSKVLAFCLNVMGLELLTGSYGSEYRALHRTVLRWTVRNFANLYQANPRVGAECLVDGFLYDETTNRLVKTWPAEGLRLEPRSVYLQLRTVSDHR